MDATSVQPEVPTLKTTLKTTLANTLRTALSAKAVRGLLGLVTRGVWLHRVIGKGERGLRGQRHTGEAQGCDPLQVTVKCFGKTHCCLTARRTLRALVEEDEKAAVNHGAVRCRRLMIVRAFVVVRLDLAQVCCGRPCLARTDTSLIGQGREPLVARLASPRQW